jgi:hypothetical protein
LLTHPVSPAIGFGPGGDLAFLIGQRRDHAVEALIHFAKACAHLGDERIYDPLSGLSKVLSGRIPA